MHISVYYVHLGNLGEIDAIITWSLEMAFSQIINIQNAVSFEEAKSLLIGQVI